MANGAPKKIEISPMLALELAALVDASKAFTLAYQRSEDFVSGDQDEWSIQTVDGLSPEQEQAYWLGVSASLAYDLEHARTRLVNAGQSVAALWFRERSYDNNVDLSST